MSLTVNQSLNAPANVASVFAGTEPRRAPLQDDKRLSGTAGTEMGRGIRVSQQAINQLDNERNKQPNFQNATNFQNGISSRGQQAVAAYQSQQNEQRRAEVQSLLGVDLYA